LSSQRIGPVSLNLKLYPSSSFKEHPAGITAWFLPLRQDVYAEGEERFSAGENLFCFRRGTAGIRRMEIPIVSGMMGESESAMFYGIYL